MPLLPTGAPPRSATPHVVTATVDDGAIGMSSVKAHAASATVPAPPPDSLSPGPSAAYVARAGALNLAARLVSGAGTLGLAVLTTNLLDTHGRGVYVLLTTWVAIGSTIITGGMAVLAADLIHRRQDEAALHGASTAIGATSVLLLIPLSLVMSLLWGATLAGALVIAALLTALLTYTGFEVAIAQAQGNVLTVSLVGIGMDVLPLAATAVAAIIVAPTATSLIGAWAVAALLTALVQFLFAVRNGSVMPWRAWDAALSIMRRSMGVALWKGATLLCSRIDVLIVAAVLSTSSAGVYSVPVALAASLLLLSRSLLTATYHPIMTAPATQVASRLGMALRHSVIVVLVAGGLAIPLVAVASAFVFGEAYGDIWQPFAVLVASSACLAVAEITGQVLLTRFERHRELVITWLVALAINGVLAAAGAAWFGLVGAAASTTVTYLCAAFVQVWFCARLLSVPLRDLAVPRRSGLGLYVRAVRSILARLRLMVAHAPW
jgi:O-antigen/teichoic acid export membrane protein